MRDRTVPLAAPENLFGKPVLKWGGRWDLNPRPLEPQSSALPLSYAHHCKTLPFTSLRSRLPPRRMPETGAPGRTRTCSRRLRRPMLYPVELQALDPVHRRSSQPSVVAVLPHLSTRIILAAQTGRGGRIRTCDLLLPKQLRYQAALHPGKPRSIAETARPRQLPDAHSGAQPILAA